MATDTETTEAEIREAVRNALARNGEVALNYDVRGRSSMPITLDDFALIGIAARFWLAGLDTPEGQTP